MTDEADIQFLQSLPGYPFLPCPICKGTEGCDHSVPERARGAGINLPKWPPTPGDLQ